MMFGHYTRNQPKNRKFELKILLRCSFAKAKFGTLHFLKRIYLGKKSRNFQNPNFV